MADDWVKKYAEPKVKRENREAAELRKAELVQVSADTFFRALSDRVRLDVDAFQKASGDAKLTYQFVPPRTFVVRTGEYPSHHVLLQLIANGVKFHSHRNLPGMCQGRHPRRGCQETHK